MKTKIIHTIFFLSVLTGYILAQTPGFNYQAVLRDKEGAPMPNAQVTLHISLTNGPAGQVLYKESQSLTSNELGMLNTTIGNGTVETGQFGDIIGIQNLNIKIEADLPGEPDIVDFGYTPLGATHFALYGEDADADPKNEMQALSLEGDSLKISDGVGVSLEKFKTPWSMDGQMIQVKDQDGNIAHQFDQNGSGLHAGVMEYGSGLLINMQDTVLYFTPTENGMFIGSSADPPVRKNRDRRFGPLVSFNHVNVETLRADFNNGVAIEGVTLEGMGVRGSSNKGIGVYGGSGTGTGVEGDSDDGPGVKGISKTASGVEGETKSGIGVKGTSDTKEGVYGESKANFGIYGITKGGGDMAGVYGKGMAGDGVKGESEENYGVRGNGGRAGVFGRSSDGVGVLGIGDIGGRFLGDVEIMDGGLKIDQVDNDNADKILVWSDDKYVRYRGLDEIFDGIEGGVPFNGCLDNLDFKITTNKDPFFTISQSKIVDLKGKFTATNETGRAIIGISTSEVGVQGLSSSSVGVFGVSTGEKEGVLGKSDGGIGVRGTSANGIGVYGIGGDAAGKFLGDVLIEDMGQLKIDKVEPENSDKILVWANDKFVKYRSLSEALTDIEGGTPFNGCLDNVDFKVTTNNDPFFSISQNKTLTYSGEATFDNRNISNSPLALLVKASNNGIKSESGGNAIVGITNGSGITSGVIGTDFTASGGQGVLGESNSGIGVMGSGVIGIQGVGNTAGKFLGNVLIESEGKLKIDQVETDNSDKILVWADDKFVKYRSLEEISKWNCLEDGSIEFAGVTIGMDGSIQITKENTPTTKTILDMSAGTASSEFLDSEGNFLAGLTGSEGDDGARTAFQSGGTIATGNNNGPLTLSGAFPGSDPTNGFQIVFNGQNFSTVNTVNSEAAGTSTVFGANGKQNAAMSTFAGSPNHGMVAVYGEDGVTPRAYMRSTATSSEVAANVFTTLAAPTARSDQIVAFAAPMGGEAAAYDRGTAQLINGEATVICPEHFQWVADEASMTVTITPLSAESKGVAVIEKSNGGFKVKEMHGGKGNYAFDYLVMCKRKDQKDFQVRRQTPEIMADKTQEMLQYLPKGPLKSIRDLYKEN